MNRRTRQHIDDLTEELRHKDRIHKALLAGHDAICQERDGAKLAADMLARESDLLDHKLRTVKQYAENLLGSGSSAYRKAGTRLLEILEGPGADDQPEEASA